MARVAAMVVSKRVWFAFSSFTSLVLAMMVLASCEPDEFVPVGARTAHAGAR